MLASIRSTAILSALSIMLSVTGCAGDSEEPRVPGATETAGPPATVDSGHDHAHPSEGPHGGSLIELGNEEYHAELVHDDQVGTITVYILDAAAKVGVPIEAADVTINLTHDGRGEQFKLTASPDANDPAGKCSRFISTERELGEDLDHEGADAQLVVQIHGKSYRGAIAHEHGESEHGHDH